MRQNDEAGSELIEMKATKALRAMKVASVTKFTPHNQVPIIQDLRPGHSLVTKASLDRL